MTLLKIAFLIGFLFCSDIAQASQAIFRSRLGDGTKGEIRAVGITPPKEWRAVEPVNRDPLSLAQWIPKGRACVSGASTVISAYAVDVGQAGAHKLVQKWLPSANSFYVVSPEGGFAVVRAFSTTTEGLSKIVLAYPLSDRAVTPLTGWIDGVSIVFVAESTSEPIEALESRLRETLRNRVAAASTAKSLNHPFVLLGKKWSKPLADRWQAGDSKKRAADLISQAYALFAESGGYVTQGQIFLLQAAEIGDPQAKMDLIRLSRLAILQVDVAAETLSAWERDLDKKGLEDARYFAAAKAQLSDEQESGQIAMRSLGKCGHPEARRNLIKKQVQSFNARERYLGRLAVVELMQEPPLESSVKVTHRIPRAIEGLTTHQLKQAAVLKTACPNQNDPEESLFLSKTDFKTGKSFKKNQQLKEKALAQPDEPEFPELKEALRMDRLANAGSQSQLKEALTIACNWQGSDVDRENLISELAIRKDGIGKWKRFRSCSSISEFKLAQVCRSRDLKQNSINLETRFNDILISSGMSYAENPSAVAAAAAFRKKAVGFADKLLEKSYAHANTLAEKKELDQIRYALENEFMALLAATLSKENAMGLASQIGEVVTGRRLLVLPTESDNVEIALLRQAPTVKFLKREQERLEAHFQALLKSIQEADKIDISQEFKKNFAAAYEAWEEYRAAHAKFVAKVAETHPHASGHGLAANLWFQIEGIYYFEKIRELQLNRAPDTGIRAVSSEGPKGVDFGSEDQSIFSDEEDSP